MTKRYQSVEQLVRTRRSQSLGGVLNPAWSEHLFSLLSLVVAILATVASIAQSVLLYQQADAPYSALVYEEQIGRAVKTVDFMTALRADVERWEALHEAQDPEEASVPSEVRQRMIQFAALAEGAWLLTPNAQQKISQAAIAFGKVGRRCLIVRYRGTAKSAGWSTECNALFAEHDSSLRAAMEATLQESGFDRRIKAFEANRTRQ